LISIGKIEPIHYNNAQVSREFHAIIFVRKTDMKKNLLELVEEFKRLERKRKLLGGKLPLSEEERLVYLKDYLAQHLHGETPRNERRKDLRVPVNIRVRYKSEETFVNNYIHNLSYGGVFITTPEPLPLDTKIKLNLIFEDKGVEVEVEGKVVWENTMGGRRSDITKPGMGIKFLKVDKQTQQIIDEMVHEKIEEHIRLKQESDEKKKK